MEMSKINDDDLDEKPLDPEMEKVRRKMVRLLAVSIGVMFIGLMTVLGAIVYKFTQSRRCTGHRKARRRLFACSVPSDAPVEGCRRALPAGSSLKASRSTATGSGFSAGLPMVRSGSSFTTSRSGGSLATLS
jgi:hypothetical protein